MTGTRRLLALAAGFASGDPASLRTLPGVPR